MDNQFKPVNSKRFGQENPASPAPIGISSQVNNRVNDVPPDNFATPQSSPPQALSTPQYQPLQHTPVAPDQYVQTENQTSQESNKSYVAAWLLAFFFGALGVDRFYRGHIVRGILKLLTLGGLGLWAFIDWLMIGFGKPKDKSGKLLRGYAQNKTVVHILTAIGLVVGLVVPGVILLVVFLAVPSLQRNAHDIQRKTDVALIASAISTFDKSNGGIPTSLAQGSSKNSINLCGSDCMSGNTVAQQLGYYSASNIVFKSYASNLQVPDTNTIYIVDNASCNSAQTGLGSQTSSVTTPSVAILYALDSGNGLHQQCQQL